MVDPNHDVQVVGDGMSLHHIITMFVLIAVSVGTFVDCLGGQWWAHSLNLGYILPEDHVKSTISSVFAGNHVNSFNPGTQYA